LGLLSKKAVSYSSASITNQDPEPKQKLLLKLAATPPIKKPGSKPASAKICATIEVVVVLPCVPAIAITRYRDKMCCASHSGPEK
jgi:hypothetical protein